MSATVEMPLFFTVISQELKLILSSKTFYFSYLRVALVFNRDNFLLHFSKTFSSPGEVISINNETVRHKRSQMNLSFESSFN